MKEKQKLSFLSGKYLPQRIIAMLLAVTIMGMGVSFFRLANMGADPFSTMNLGISARIGLSFGTWQAILNIALLLIIICVDRSMLGLGTIGNMFMCGFSADFFTPILAHFLPPASELSLLLRVVLTLIGVSLALVGVSFYVTSDLGMAPYDCISYIVPERTKIPFKWWRIFLDFTCIILGLLFGRGLENSASFGLASILFAFCTGPILPWLNKHMAGPLLKAEKVR